MSIELIDQIVSPYEKHFLEKGYLNLPEFLEKENVASDLRRIIANHFDYPEPILPWEDSKDTFTITTPCRFGIDNVTFRFNFMIDSRNPLNYLSLESLDISINGNKPFNFNITDIKKMPDAEQAYQVTKVQNNYHFQRLLEKQNSNTHSSKSMRRS